MLPPAFVQRLAAPGAAPAGTPGSVLGELRHKVELQLGARHAAERLLRCWGGCSSSSYDATKAAIAKLLGEFMGSHDGAEAARCLHALNVPFFGHELVKQALYAAMEHPAQAEPLLALLQALAASGDVSQTQMGKGFQRVADNLRDLVLDNPQAPAQFTTVLALASKHDLLDGEDLQRLGAAAAGGSAAARPPSASSGAAAAGAAANGGSGAPHAGANGTAAVAPVAFPQAPGVSAFKLAAITAVKEYLLSLDAAEVGRRLAELEEPGLHHIFVKHAVQLACERKVRLGSLAAPLPPPAPRARI